MGGSLSGKKRHVVRLKRVYQPPETGDGCRVLVERLWPRGLAKEKAHVDLWLKEIAPSTGLRRWFGHDPAKWPEFRRRYRAELEENSSAVAQLLDLVRREPVTLVFAASDLEHNSAAVLKEYLEERMQAEGKTGGRRR